jgi:hypothetical protein
MVEVSSDELDPVAESLTIPVALFASGFESPPNTITVLDIQDKGVRSPDIAIGADTYPIISFLDYTDGLLLVAKCNDAACVGGNETITMLDTTGAAMFEPTSLAMGAEGNPVIAYMDTAADAITIAKCNDPACAGEDESIATVDTEARARSSSIAVGADGLPVISYIDEITGALKAVHCGTLECR